MSWYRTGTVAVTASSTNVTGTGTLWLANAAAGEAFRGPDGKFYEIGVVVSNTQLTLIDAYLGSTASGQSYAIAPTQSYIRDLATEVAAVAEAYGDVADAVDAGKVAFSASGVDINGGAIDGVVIGGTTPAAATVTTLTATGNATIGDGTGDAHTIKGTTSFGTTAWPTTVLGKSGHRVLIGDEGQLALWNETSGAGTYAPLYIGSKHTSISTAIAGACIRGGNETAGNYAGFLALCTHNSAGAMTERMRIDSAGNVAIGTTSYSHIGLIVANAALSSANQIGVLSAPVGTTSATTSVQGFNGRGDTAAGSFTCAQSIGFFADNPTKGAGSTITNLYGLLVTDLTQGTNNYGISSAVSAGTNKRNLNITGTADNYIAGNVGIGATPSAWSGGASKALQVGQFGIKQTDGANATAMATNAYYNGTNWIYAGSATATMYEQYGSSHRWSAAISGTAGNTITWAVMGYTHSTDTTSGFNTAAAAFKIYKDTATGRSINAAGTINASGADYAEYETKRAGCGDIAKGQVIGRSASGRLTDRWSEAITYGVKSTDPNLVGGDTWGNEAALGMAMPVPPSAPRVEHGAEPEDRESAAWAAWDDARQAAEADAAAAYAIAKVDYDGQMIVFAQRLEAARQQVDRIAYAGRVPCNVTGAAPGDYIVAAEGPDDSIIGQAIAPAAIDFASYRRAVGRVHRILDDGRAEIAVMVH